MRIQVIKAFYQFKYLGSCAVRNQLFLVLSYVKILKTSGLLFFKRYWPCMRRQKNNFLYGDFLIDSKSTKGWLFVLLPIN